MMRLQHPFSTRMALVGLGVFGAILSMATPATSLPGDAPVVNVSPQDGVSIPANSKGIPVVYQCPVYTSIADLPNGGGMRSYSVLFASAPDLGSDGRLLRSNIAAISGPQLFQDPELAVGQCRGIFSASSTRPETKPGTYYWQVSRLCTSCNGGYEAGPVWKFTITLTGATSALELSPLPQLFSGFAAVVNARAVDVPDGATIAIEASDGASWRELNIGTVVKNQATIPVAVEIGDVGLRASIKASSNEVVRSSEVPI